ncbi:linoleoyl-CoA desaturase [Rhodococcoides kroppenstedtii]|uniref:Linoleoyl-CoA desaturase n=1 Tax=Rhodococcoides kroppenstedtii TaxID=293050 RepID=A0A1I0STD8_9NOCA|nr:fatty acid desaturase [Rhodococcus kroppenstedtii]SFA42673.1 linoleoyl-CoA desaturase [Rhodococcus kroppenstedtii]
MAISDVKEYAHLTDADVEAIGHELDAIRREIEAARGEKDARYVRNTIRFQRTLEAVGRTTMLASNNRVAWWAGSAMLGVSKIVENMELGHNVMHGQWDWMNDPEIHSTSWEWDNTGPSEHWKQTHNYIHHKYTNVLGMDDDIGYGLIRVTRDRKWTPFNAGNLVYNTLLMLLFEYGVAVQHLELGKVAKGRVSKEETRRKLAEVGEKVGKQMLKDYALTPAVSSLSPTASFRKTLTANIMANVIRNVWTNAVIFCGHFPDGAEKFTRHDLKDETQGQWYLRQMLGSANFEAGPALAFMSGNLCYQIEHHVFPDLPSNRLAEISVKVRALCEKYDLPYTTGSFPAQYAKSWRTIAKLSLPDKFLKATADDAPETASERRFGGNTTAVVDPATGRRKGLLSAIAESKSGRGLRARFGRR